MFTRTRTLLRNVQSRNCGFSVSSQNPLSVPAAAGLDVEELVVRVADDVVLDQDVVRLPARASEGLDEVRMDAALAPAVVGHDVFEKVTSWPQM